MSDTTPFLKLLTGSFSTPAGGNPTGVMIEAAYVHHDIPARFINCDVAPAHLADAVRGAVAMGWIGFNCSLPHKQSVIKHLNELGKSASLIGAVNCVVRRGDRLIGENTDGQGFLTSLARSRTHGAQGLTFSVREVPPEPSPSNLPWRAPRRSPSSTETSNGRKNLRSTVNTSTSATARPVQWTSAYEIPPETDILVNATSVGLAPHVDERLDLAMDTLGSHLLVCDVITNPPQTNLLRTSASHGATVLDARGMLVNQAALNIWHWTGVRVDTAVLRSTLDTVLQS